MLPKLKQLPYKSRIITQYTGKGINNGIPVFDIADGQLTEMQNGYSSKYPAFTVRAGRSYYQTGTMFTPKYLGTRKDEYLMTLDSTVWKYWQTGSWVTILTGLTEAEAETVDFMDNTILVNGTDNKYWNGSSAGDVATMPDAHFLAVHRNRIYAANKNNQNLYFSALRKFDDWTTADDAGTIVVETKDGFGATGLVEYQDHIIYFKKSSMHELFGNGPASYQMQVVSEQIGCLSHRSICEVNGTLFWISSEGVRAYTGGNLPEIISSPIQKYIDNMDMNNISKAVAGTDGYRYYICLPLKDYTYYVFTYDTRYNVWYVEQEEYISCFARFKNELYAITDYYTSAYKMVGLDSWETVEWYMVTKPFNFDRISGVKTFKNVYVTFSMPEDSTMTLSATEDAEGDVNTAEYTDIYTYTASSTIQNVKASIPLTIGFNSDWVKFKISGTGPCTIHKIEIQARVKPNGW